MLSARRSLLGAAFAPLGSPGVRGCPGPARLGDAPCHAPCDAPCSGRSRASGHATGQGTFPNYWSQEGRRVPMGGKGRAAFAGSTAELGGARPAAVGSKALASALAARVQKVVDKQLKSL